MSDDTRPTGAGSGDTAWDGPDVTACTRCPELVAARSGIVNGVGPADAPLLLIGEAPGADEDAAGSPFVGRSGGVLDEALRAAGTVRDAVRISNCVRCRPPDNRDPRVSERANCRDHLDREVRHVDPTLVVALGKVPAEQLLDRSVAVTSAAGTVEPCTFGDATYPVMVSVHPAATLYDPSQRETLEDVLATAVDRAGLSTSDPQPSLDDY